MASIVEQCSVFSLFHGEGYITRAPASYAWPVAVAFLRAHGAAASAASVKHAVAVLDRIVSNGARKGYFSWVGLGGVDAAAALLPLLSTQRSHHGDAGVRDGITRVLQWLPAVSFAAPAPASAPTAPQLARALMGAGRVVDAAREEARAGARDALPGLVRLLRGALTPGGGGGGGAGGGAAAAARAAPAAAVASGSGAGAGAGAAGAAAAAAGAGAARAAPSYEPAVAAARDVVSAVCNVIERAVHEASKSGGGGAAAAAAQCAGLEAAGAVDALRAIADGRGGAALEGAPQAAAAAARQRATGTPRSPSPPPPPRECFKCCAYATYCPHGRGGGSSDASDGSSGGSDSGDYHSGRDEYDDSGYSDCDYY